MTWCLLRGNEGLAALRLKLQEKFTHQVKTEGGPHLEPGGETENAESVDSSTNIMDGGCSQMIV